MILARNHCVVRQDIEDHQVNGGELVLRHTPLLIMKQHYWSMTKHPVPTTKPQILTILIFWLFGILNEENAIRENKTFTIVERNVEMKVIPCRYVFNVKNGKAKVRIVAKGYRQTHGTDYFETYSPVVSFQAVRCFLAFVAHYERDCDQMDVVIAFLNGELDEKIYMQILSGFVTHKNSGMVCQLHKALYGLKQAPRQWLGKINSFLTEELEFKACSYEPCLYFRHKENKIVIIVLYEDDLLIAGNSRSVLDDVKKELSSQYKMKDLGEAKEFLGICITRDRGQNVLRIDQSLYAYKILERFHMENAKGCDSPMSTNLDSLTEESEPLSTEFPYRESIGSLMYLALVTRPDIAFPVAILSQYCSAPSSEHWKAVERELRYVHKTCVEIIPTKLSICKVLFRRYWYLHIPFINYYH